MTFQAEEDLHCPWLSKSFLSTIAAPEGSSEKAVLTGAYERWPWQAKQMEASDPRTCDD
jgi:hypothetical protein